MLGWTTDIRSSRLDSHTIKLNGQHWVNYSVKININMELVLLLINDYETESVGGGRGRVVIKIKYQNCVSFPATSSPELIDVPSVDSEGE